MATDSVPPIPAHDTQQSARYLRCFSITLGLMLASLASWNFAIDPLRVYRAPWLDLGYLEDQRGANPGLARTCDYEGVVIGTSMTENYLEADIEQTLGWRALRLSMKGALLREQHLILDQALATGKVQHVLWGLDQFALTAGPEAVADPGGFPWHLYERTPRTHLQYLFSAKTLGQTLSALSGKTPRTLDERCVWHHRKEFGVARVQADWERRVRQASSAAPFDAAACTAAAEQHLLAVIRQHPEVEFTIFYQPDSAANGLFELRHQPEAFAARLAFKEQLSHDLCELPNVRLYDFELAEFTYELGEYSDLSHYSLKINRTVLNDIREGHHRVTPDEIGQRTVEITAALTRVEQAITRGAHPWGDWLSPRSSAVAVQPLREAPR